MRSYLTRVISAFRTRPPEDRSRWPVTDQQPSNDRHKGPAWLCSHVRSRSDGTSNDTGGAFERRVSEVTLPEILIETSCEDRRPAPGPSPYELARYRRGRKASDTDPTTSGFGIVSEDAKASCCTRDEGRPFGVAEGGGFKQPEPLRSKAAANVMEKAWQ